jgi:hypothetical protein
LHRRIVKRGARLVLVPCVCAVTLAGCGSTGLVGNLNAGSLSGVSHVRPGETVDSVGWLANRSGRPVTLKSATILPLKGFHAPQLVGVAVERRGRTLHGAMVGGEAIGWPNRTQHVVPLSGYRLPAHGSWDRNVALVVFALAARRPGRYALAGVSVTVVENGSVVTAPAIGPVAFCVSTHRPPVSCPASFTNRAFRASIALK